MPPILSENLISLLKSVDTPTVCNAIEVVQGKRGFTGFTKAPLFCVNPSLPSIFGVARTARIKASTPPTQSNEEVKNTRIGYYRYMFESPQPAVCVVEDLDYPTCRGAYWGEINSNIHQRFKLSGTITNGLVRDLANNAENYQILASSVGVSHAFVHVVDYGNPVEIFGLKIQENDFIHADQHGAVVVPNDIIPELENGINKLIENENIILTTVKNPDCSFEDFQKGWEGYINTRT